MATALVSLLGGIPVRGSVAMTGEITLRGKVLPIGGVKEKVLAAYRYGTTDLILPKENEKDLAEIPDDISRQQTFHLVEHMDEVLELALERPLPSVGLKREEGDADMEGRPADGSITH